MPGLFATLAHQGAGSGSASLTRRPRHCDAWAFKPKRPWSRLHKSKAISSHSQTYHTSLWGAPSSTMRIRCAPDRTAGSVLLLHPASPWLHVLLVSNLLCFLRLSFKLQSFVMLWQRGTAPCPTCRQGRCPSCLAGLCSVSNVGARGAAAGASSHPAPAVANLLLLWRALMRCCPGVQEGGETVLLWLDEAALQSGHGHLHLSYRRACLATCLSACLSKSASAQLLRRCSRLNMLAWHEQGAFTG